MGKHAVKIGRKIDTIVSDVEVGGIGHQSLMAPVMVFIKSQCFVTDGTVVITKEKLMSQFQLTV